LPALASGDIVSCMQSAGTTTVRRGPYLFTVGLLVLSLAPGAGAEGKRGSQPFELKDGDRVVFVGGTLIEREGQLGYIETVLTARFPDRNVTFRNLGQSADTVRADARNLNAGWADFGPAEQGFKRLQKLIGEIKPTVIIANYGMTESFEGKKGLEDFARGYERLLVMMVKTAGTNPRVVLISPNHHEGLPGAPGLPDPSEHNRNLELYRDEIRRLAERRGTRFVDLYELTKQSPGERPLTDNGIHPNEHGFRVIAVRLAGALGMPKPPRGPALSEAPYEGQTEQLRKLIVAKNFDYFNYWRPQNDTYILGYRKKEQGNNAVEMPQFLPLVEAKEKQIATLRAAAR
jgi:lysophospholipase L1-like esterase